MCLPRAARTAWHVPRADAPVRPMAALPAETRTRIPPHPPGARRRLVGLPAPAPSTCSPSSLDLTSVFDQQDEGHSSKSRSCKNSHKRVMLPWLESLLGAQKHDDPCLQSGGGGPFSAPSCFLF